MTDDPDSLRIMDQICDQFELLLARGEQPELEQFLVQAPEDSRGGLFGELLHLELNYRLTVDADPEIGSYLSRFPEFESEVKQQFSKLQIEPPSCESSSVETVPPDTHQYVDAPTVLPGAKNTAGSPNETTILGDSSETKSAEKSSREFGDYEIIEEIARGGMGVVYRARQTKLNRIVALKMILAGQLAGEEAVQRFHAEATAAANLDHPGIVPIFEIGEQDGQHYFSMGFIDGESLSDRVAEGPLATREAAEITMQIAEAVAFAHENGVIHRDLKPANVLIDSTGLPKVTDFGLAKRNEEDSNLTRTGAVMGTPSYMPPEQAAGKEVGAPADVYSLGAILYCLLTARPPFQAATSLDTLIQVMDQDPVPPMRLNALVDRDLDTICLRCLQKDPSQRYESAAELAADLSRFLDGEPINARPVNVLERSVKWVRRRPVISGLLAMVLLLAVGGMTGIIWNWREAVFQFGRAEDSLEKMKQAYGVAEARRITAENAKKKETKAREEAEDATKKALEAKGRESKAKEREKLARVRAENDRDAKEVALQRAKGLALTAQSNSVRKSHPALSLLLAIESVKKNPSRMTFANLYQARKSSREIATYKNNGGVQGISVSRDGNLAAVACADRRFTIWDTKTGRRKWSSADHGLQVETVALSSDGNKLAATLLGDLPSYLVGSNPANKGVANFLQGLVKKKESQKPTHLTDRVVRVWDVKSRKELFRLIGHSDRVSCVKFARNGELIFTSSWDRTVRMWDGQTGKELKKWTDIDGRPIKSFDVTHDGEVLVAFTELTTYMSQYNTESVKDKSRVDPDEPLPPVRGVGNINISQISVPETGREPALFFLIETSKEKGMNYCRNKTVKSTCAAISDDASLVAFGSKKGPAFVYRNGNWEEPVMLVGHSAEVTEIAFSRDGKKIVTCSDDESVRVWNVAGGPPIFVLRGHVGKTTAAEFGPKGDILFSSGDSTLRKWDLKEIPALARQMEGHDKRVYTVGFDPTGTKVCSSGADRRSFVWEIANGNKQNCGKEGEKKTVARWIKYSPDGKYLLSDAYHYKSLRVWDAEKKVVVTEFGAGRGSARAAISPDGTRVVSVSDEFKRNLINNGKGTHQYNSFSDNAGYVRIWNAQTGEQIVELKQRTHPYFMPKISNDSKWLVISLHDEDKENLKRVSIVDLINGQVVRQFPPSQSAILCADIHPDDQWVAVGSRRSVKVFDLRNGSQVAELVGFKTGVHLCEFSQDGKQLVTVDERTIHVWDSESYSLISTLRGHEKMIKKIRFNPDGSKLLTLSEDETAGLWDIRAERLEALFQASHDDRITDADLSPDGKWVVTGSDDGSIRIWSVDIWPAINSRVSRKLTGSEKKQYDLETWMQTLGDRFSSPPRKKQPRK